MTDQQFDIDTILDTAANQLQDRLEELEPYVNEAKSIQAQLTKLGVNTSTRAPKGQRLAEFVKVVQRHPSGIRIAEVAREMDTQASYVYKLRDAAVEAGDVEVRDQQVYPVAA
jgi:hypothetical protein